MTLPISAPIAGRRGGGQCTHGHGKLVSFSSAVVVVTPRHFSSVCTVILACDVMVCAGPSTAQATTQCVRLRHRLATRPDSRARQVSNILRGVVDLRPVNDSLRPFACCLVYLSCTAKEDADSLFSRSEHLSATGPRSYGPRISSSGDGAVYCVIPASRGRPKPRSRSAVAAAILALSD